MYIIKLPGFFLTQMNHLQAKNIEAFVFDFLNDLADHLFFDRIGLDNGQGSFHHFKPLFQTVEWTSVQVILYTSKRYHGQQLQLFFDISCCRNYNKKVMSQEKILETQERLKKYCLEELGIDLFGVADIRFIRESFNLPAHLIRRYDFAICLGKEVLSSVLDDINGAPTALYFHHYRQLNAFLDRAALSLASRITAMGCLAMPVAASQVIDWKNQIAHLSHKKVGELAGLGWLGRNNLLVNPKLGSRFRLVTILTNLSLSPGSPLPFSCGECRRCQAVCPAGAIKDQPFEFDHLACFEKLKEFRNRGLVGQYICGICVKACYGEKNRLEEKT